MSGFSLAAVFRYPQCSIPDAAAGSRANRPDFGVRSVAMTGRISYVITS
jgi:hypothetical protein